MIQRRFEAAAPRPSRSQKVHIAVRQRVEIGNAPATSSFYDLIHPNPPAIWRNDGNSYISQVENGRACPSPRYLERMAAALGLGVEALLDGVVYRPSRPGPKPLNPYAQELRRHFRPVPPLRSLATIRVAFKLAGYTRMGSERVESLVSRAGRPRRYWAAVKLLGELLNAPEQTFLLHVLARGGVEEVRPHRLGFPLPVVVQPGRPVLAVVVPIQDGMPVIFPQVGVPVRGVCYTLDFLVGVSIGGRCLWLDVELDGPTHRLRRERDGRRAEDLGLETIRVPVAEVDRRDFFERLERAIRHRFL